MPLLRVVQLGGDGRHEVVGGGREESSASKCVEIVDQSACDTVSRFRTKQRGKR